ncbi:hypothetical protein FG386_000187 [Cryptosporidium ryanae]|uniref:uncharacterized protein n=1 Tax=Cryptosporidium ryanae TaxID=515981 RepID=UPI00351A1D5A|nr:hypothetical protein FG386_000187 [Cryptosporidium ryanae]
MIPDKMRSLTSIMLIRVYMGNYCGIPPNKLKIVRENGEKPYILFEEENKYNIHFNISHDNEIVVIAISKFIIGVDIMKLELPDRKRNENRIENETHVSRFLLNMKNVFSDSEWNYIDKDISKFMEYWTIKESFVKCVGVGLYIDPARLKIEKDCCLDEIHSSRIYMDNVMQVSKWI